MFIPVLQVILIFIATVVSIWELLCMLLNGEQAHLTKILIPDFRILQ